MSTHSPHSSAHRAYRSGIQARTGEVQFQTVVEETDLLILAEHNMSQLALECVDELRGQLKAWFTLHPDFLHSLVPVTVPEHAPEIIQRMAHAGTICGVGPMAAVAGTVSQMVAERLHEHSANVLVENGGDVFMYSNRPRTCAILSDPTHEARIGLSLGAEDFPVALCASSAKIGHSLSLGHGDLVVVRSRDASLADAAATALCNMVQERKDLRHVTEQAQAWEQDGIEGIFAQCGQTLTAWGKIELTAL